PMGRRRAGQIWPVRLLPGPRLIALFVGRHIDGVVEPAVPRRRHRRGLGLAVVDHPAPFHQQRRIDLAAAGAEIAVAELVLTDRFAVPPGPELGAEGLAIPPGEKAEEKGFHRPRWI